MLEDSDALHRLLRSGVSELSKFGKEERDDAAELIHKTQGYIGTVPGSLRRGLGGAREINEQYVHFHRATDKVVNVASVGRSRPDSALSTCRLALSHAANSLKSGSTIEFMRRRFWCFQRAQLVSTRDLWLIPSSPSIPACSLSDPGLKSYSPHERLSLRLQAGQDGQRFRSDR